MLNLSSGSHARLRGEIVHVAHVERVPRHRNLLGEVIPTSFRAVCVWQDGRWDNAVDVRELRHVSEPS